MHLKKLLSNLKNILITVLMWVLNYSISNISKIIINGPISKKHFLKNKYPGVTEYIFDKSKIKISKILLC